MLALYIFLGFFVVVVVYLVVIIFFPVLKVKEQPFKKNKDINAKRPPKCRQDIEYFVSNTKVRGWLYLPESSEKLLPLIILSQGFNGTKDAILEKYALKFVKNGYGAITYDYRHYGDSDGMPRQIYCGKEQLDDLRGAIAYARNRDEIDPDKIVLWGTSAAGNYGILIASEDRRIAGVIAQCGAYDHDEDSKLWKEKGDGIGFFLKLFVHAQRDKGRSRFGLSRHKISAYGKPGTTAMFRGKGVFEGAERLAADSINFKNEICAGFLVMPQVGDPIKAAEQVKAPLLMLVCEYDEILSPKSHIKMSGNPGQFRRG